MSEALLEIEKLGVSFGRERVRVLDAISLSVGRGEIVALVGESGSGKSVTALATMRLLAGSARIEGGAIRLGGEDLLALPEPAMRARRGRDLAMIFQEPMTSLNPLFRAGFQIGETLEAHLGISRREARQRAIALMRAVGIASPETRVDAFPHQLSGGMRQRVMIAMAIACEPRLLIADEPTTALDVTIQAQILTLIRALRESRGMGVLLITHDLGVVAGMADRVVVMYAGQIVEEAPVGALFARPRHPYSRMLLRAVPRIARKLDRLATIAGTTPPPSRFPTGCRFHTRCPDAVERCRAQQPDLLDDAAGRRVRCWRADESGLASEAA